MKKKNGRPVLLWLCVLIGLVAAGLVVYFTLVKRAPDEEMVEDAGVPDRKIMPDQKARAPLMGEEEPVGPVGRASVSTGETTEEGPVRRISRNSRMLLSSSTTKRPMSKIWKQTRISMNASKP